MTVSSRPIWHASCTDESRLACGSIASRGAEAWFVPQSYRPGIEADTNFGDVSVRLAGVQVVCYLLSEVRHRSTQRAFAF